MYGSLRRAYSKDLFNERETRAYFSKCIGEMADEVTKISDTDIVSCDFQEWVAYLLSKYYISPITIFESNIEKKLVEIKVKKENVWGRHFNQPSYIEVDGVRVVFVIPYDGDPELFELRPSTCILQRFETNNFIKPCGETYGSFTLGFDYEKQDLTDRGEEMAAYVQTQFENEFKSYVEMISYINNEVKVYNDGLESLALQFLNERKKRADSISAISAALQIPLNKSENAPNTKPIKLKRVVRKPCPPPSKSSGVPEWCVSDNDYVNINNIIAMCGTTMEKTARTYYGNNEEELRDHLLAALNTHYDAATGETFRKLGKADIHIEFENKSAFIGECKIWHGIKVFQGAIQQAINYSTWRDLKVSVVVFNKENQAFLDVLKKIGSWVESSTVSHIQQQANIWKCKYYRKDMNVNIQLTILVFDLYVDKSQFKDSRYED